MSSKFYDILEIPQNSSQEDIKKVYKKLALTHHPDRGGDPEKFKEVNEAYEVLSDPNKKSQLDIIPIAERVNFSQINNILSTIKQNINIGLTLNTELYCVYVGFDQLLEYDRWNICQTCHGNGSKDPDFSPICRACNGQGNITIIRQMQQFHITQSSTCNQCGGMGKILSISMACPECKGMTVKIEKISKQCNIPIGSKQDAVLTLKGMGHQLPNQPAGDLYIKININNTKFPEIIRQDNNLIYRKKITLYESLVEATFAIKQLDNTDIYIQNKNSIIKPGDKKTIKNLGMRYMNNNNIDSGDLVIEFDVEFPTTIQNKELLKQVLDIPPEIELTDVPLNI
jgi:DnaJ family protein A protein 2